MARLAESAWSRGETRGPISALLYTIFSLLGYISIEALKTLHYREKSTLAVPEKLLTMCLAREIVNVTH